MARFASAMWLSAPAFQKGAFQSDAFQTGLPADEPTRLEALYVNYSSTGWLVAPPIDCDTVEANVKSALAMLDAQEQRLLQ